MSCKNFFVTILCVCNSGVSQFAAPNFYMFFLTFVYSNGYITSADAFQMIFFSQIIRGRVVYAGYLIQKNHNNNIKLKILKYVSHFAVYDVILCSILVKSPEPFEPIRVANSMWCESFKPHLNWEAWSTVNSYFQANKRHVGGLRQMAKFAILGSESFFSSTFELIIVGSDGHYVKTLVKIILCSVSS